MATADSRPKCPVCGARVGDAASRDAAGRVLAMPVIRPEFQNPKRAARAAIMRANNRKAASK